MSTPKNWLVTRKITAARGYQVFSVAAETPEEAIKLVNEGEGEFHSEELDITGLALATKAEEA